MAARDDVYYKAMLARDSRFDGTFFVGVKTTGIFCRPICPAKPKRQNVEFFAHALDAERAGYRPCLRCRPEAAPLSPAWIGKSAVVQRALKAIHTQDVLDLNEDRFAERFGVTARHLRRLFKEEIGKTPKQIAFENRLGLARGLAIETGLPLTQVAFASGFQSVRRFNDAFKARFKRSPSHVRKTKLTPDSPLVIPLAYRPPYDFKGLLTSYQAHRIGDLEIVSETELSRYVSFNDSEGWIRVRNDEERNRVLVEIDFPDVTAIPFIIARVRQMFDLDADPLLLAQAFETDLKLQRLHARHPGIRLPSGWDPFELAVATILGQLVSVEQARKLTAQLMQICGARSSVVVGADGSPLALFPSAKNMISADLQPLRTTEKRRATLKAFAHAIDERRISLDPTQNVDEFRTAVRQIAGIGEWTADYMALKVLRHTDAFPRTDLILKRALEKHGPQSIERLRPWSGYAAALFWKDSY